MSALAFQRLELSCQVPSDDYSGFTRHRFPIRFILSKNPVFVLTHLALGALVGNIRSGTKIAFLISSKNDRQQTIDP